MHKSIYEKLIELENLFACWSEFKQGKTNRSDVIEFERDLEDNIFALHEELSQQTYRHGPYYTFHINDPKSRIINKAMARDRLVHHAVFNELYRIYDSTFIYHSYSSRINKGTHLAVLNLSKCLRAMSKNHARPVYALKCDIKKFFRSISHKKLLHDMQNRIKDSKFLWLIEEVVNSFASQNSVGGGSIIAGLPIGNVTSQIFANIYLNELDQFIKHTLRVKYYFRYADDFIIVHHSNEYLESILLSIDRFLNDTLLLKLHPGKIHIRKFRQGIDFLGYIILPHYTVLRTKTKRRMFKKLKSKKQQLEESLITKESFNQSLQSYLGMLQHCSGHKVSVKIEQVF